MIYVPQFWAQLFWLALTPVKEKRMNIGQAIEHMRTGEHVARAGWNGKGQWIAMQMPNSLSKMRKPYIYIHPVDGELVPWHASQTDILADDWEIAL